MSKKYKVITIVTVILAVVALCAFVFRDYIKLAIIYFKYDSKQTEKLIDENAERSYDAVFDYFKGQNDFSEEEKQAIKSGELSEEELTDIIASKIDKKESSAEKEQTPKIDEGSDKSEEKHADQTVPETKTEQSDGAPQVSEDLNRKKANCVAKLYTYKSYYIGKLDGMIEEAAAEYRALPEEQRTQKAKKDIVSKKVSAAGALENECDAKVKEVLTELSKLLSENKESGELVTKLSEAYNEEKTLKRAYYLDMMTGK